MLNQLRTRLTEARKAGRAEEMSVLQVLIGEITTQEARTGKAMTDEDCERVVRKVLESNTETLKLLTEKGLTDGKDYGKLKAESDYLASLLPKTLTVDEIKEQLATQVEALKSAKSDGQAVGIAMKHFKASSLKVLGEDVNKAVKQLRSPA